MHHPESYRSLELLCRQQAARSITSAARTELECMALEDKRLAERLEKQLPEADRREKERITAS